MKIIIDAEHFTTIIRYLPETKSGVKNGRFTGAQMGDQQVILDAGDCELGANADG